MAFSSNTICCCNLLNIPSPNPTINSSSSSFLFPSHRGRLPVVPKNKFNQISCSTQSQRKKDEEERSWRRSSTQCVFGMMACMIMSTSNMSVAPFAVDDSSSTHHAATTNEVVVDGGADTIKKKWSDKQRVCQPWHLNSLETIVPENLPRPSAHRRSESISTNISPPLVNSTVVVLQTNANNCFSM